MADRIVVTGGTGFVGQTLVKTLAPECEVVVLTRGGELPPELEGLGSVRAVSWDATDDGEWARTIDGASAVVHLAGAQAVGVRWNEAVKQRLYDSRVKSARALVRAIGRAARPPRVLVSAAGVDYYAGRLTHEAVDESEPPGDSFLARLCVDWEGAVHEAETFGVRVASARLGVVLGPSDPVRQMVLPFKLFVGGPLGTGQQIFSWVHLTDTVAAFRRCLDDPALSGGVNVVAPETVPQAEFARALGRVLHRPAFMPAPAFALRAIFGEGAEPILFGRRAIPKKLEAVGFRFAFPTVESALDDVFG
jgi:uncharacterized protein (TIGR01777 family)